MSEQQILNVMKFHEVPRCWHRAFCLFIREHKLIDRRFGRYLRRDREFRAALGTMYDVLSAGHLEVFGGPSKATERALAIAGA